MSCNPYPCTCCEPPTCSLSGVRSGSYDDDVYLTWSTSTASGATAELSNEDGIISTLTGGPHNITVLRGSCKTYTLVVTNDCGTATCTWTPPARVDGCDCTECNYDPGSGIIINPQPASICVPCGCERGRGTAAAFTIAGVPVSTSNGPYNELLYQGRSPICAYPSCSGEPEPIAYLQEHYMVKWEGFDTMNGTYIFTLGDDNCVTCGAPFTCSISPGGYFLGEGVISVRDYAAGPPPCAPEPLQAFKTATIQLALSWDVPPAAAGTPIFPATINCRALSSSSPSLYFRVVSTDYPGAPTGWIAFNLESTYFDLTSDNCTKGWLHKLATTSAPTTVGTCVDRPAGQTPYNPHVGMFPDMEDASFVIMRDHFLGYFADIDLSFTTVGW